MEDLKNLHRWDVLAVSCIDGRFIKRTIDWVTEKTGGVFDFRTEIGSSKAIIDSLEDRERFFNIVETSIKLHSIKEIWLIDHIDCGAYGGSKQFASEKDEKQFHKEKLTEATKIINQRYPDLLLKKVFIDWDDIIQCE